MKLSVFLLAYNHERFIEQAVRGVLMQRTNFAYELVIGEDASTDGTTAIVRGLQAEYPEMIRATLRTHNVGMHRNFIETYRACTGTYVAFLDGDDYWTDPDKLQKQVDFLDAHSECSSCFHNVQLRCEEREVMTGLALDPGETRRRWELEDLIEEPTMPSCSIVARNGLIDHFPDWLPEVAVVDWIFNLLNARHGSAGYLPEPMAVYRQHTGGVWGRHDRLWRKDQLLKIYERLPSILNRRHEPLIRKCLASLRTWYELEATRQELDASRAWNEELQRGRDEMARQLNEAVQAWHESQAYIGELTKKYDTAQADGQTLREAVLRLEAELQADRETIRLLQREREDYRSRLGQIEASRSWRLVTRLRRHLGFSRHAGCVTMPRGEAP